MTNNKQQTAVEWLIRTLDLDNNPFNLKIINRAKEMEKEQHRVTAEDFYYGNWGYEKFYDYYNETYGGGEQ